MTNVHDFSIQCNVCVSFKRWKYIITKNMCSQLSEITFHMLTCESY